MSFWTKERIAALQRLWAEGNSATTTAAILNCTRNAVIGKLHRLKVPEPATKIFVPRDRTSTRKDPRDIKANARARLQRYRTKKKESRWEDKREVRAEFLAGGASPHSAAYRKHLPPLPEMTKGELRAMLAIAMQNTAAMS